MFFVLLILMVAFPLWSLIFVVFKGSFRTNSPADLRARPIVAAHATGDGADVASSGWTALDDRQLTRLLKGSASS